MSSGGAVPGGAPLPVPPDALVGRGPDLARLGRLMAADDTRLVTLTGAPGVGKTRLALAVARAAAFADGVVYVDLTTAGSVDAAVGELAGAVGWGGDTPATPDGLAAAVAGRELLLVVDNVEHVLGVGTALSVALARCPRLRVLATSRERLHLRAEREVPVLPLALPGPDEVADLGRLASTPSVQMLVERVRAFDPAFAVTAANRTALAEICVRLDGLPLALELAAARLRLFSPGELTFRIRHRVLPLHSDAHDVPDRHQTLRAALSWSHDLLGPEERALFRRLSVFVGGWTTDAARAVCGVPDVVATCGSLLDKNLLRRLDRPGEAVHLGMLESLREYAGEQLEQHAEGEAVRLRHAEHYARLAAGVEARIGTAGESAALEEVGVEAANLRAALEHSLAGGRTALALPLATALGWYCYTRGQLGRGQAAVDAALAAAADPPARREDAAAADPPYDSAAADPPAPREDALAAPGAGRPASQEDALAAAVLTAGVLALGRGDLARAQEHLSASLAQNERTGSRRRAAIASAFLGHLSRALGRHDDAVAHHERAGALQGGPADAPGAAWSRYDLGLLARRRGEHDRAAELLWSALSAFRALDYPWAVGCSAWALANVELDRGRPDGAAALLREAVPCFVATDDGRGLAQCLESVAALACARRAHRDAARLLGAADVLRDGLSAPLPTEQEATQQAVLDRVAAALGGDAADLELRAGAALPRSDALLLAAGVLGDPQQGAVGSDREPADAGPGDGSPLTAREHEVALLVRQGRTNRQAARQLGISEKTVEVHVHHAMRKLGAASRAEVAAWVALRERPDRPAPSR